jgi:hypothetical protein
MDEKGRNCAVVADGRSDAVVPPFLRLLRKLRTRSLDSADLLAKPLLHNPAQMAHP